jgi:tRNA (guanine-N7-)-methyltransferase
MLTPETISVPSDWLVTGARPLEVDFGCHRGLFLVGMAALHPASNFVGIDKQEGRVVRCRQKIIRSGLANAWAVRGDGDGVLRELFPDRSVDTVHVSFPDPWPKRRHAWRRAVNREFLREVWRILKPGGVFRLMTDDEAYFREIGGCAAEWSEAPWDDGRVYVETSFERKFRELGHTPWRAALRCPAANPPARDRGPSQVGDVFPPASGSGGPPEKSRL